MKIVQWSLALFLLLATPAAAFTTRDMLGRESQLVDKTQKNVALGLLSQQDDEREAQVLAQLRLTVAETASRLGYVELSSFSQAFRRWHGMSPRAFRASRP